VICRDGFALTKQDAKAAFASAWREWVRRCMRGDYAKRRTVARDQRRLTGRVPL